MAQIMTNKHTQEEMVCMWPDEYKDLKSALHAARSDYSTLEARHAALREAVANVRKVENDEHTFNPGHWVEQRLVWQEKRDAARAEVDRLMGEE